MISKKLVLRFPRNLVGQPTISRLVKTYDLSFNILQAKVTPNEEGLMIIEFSGEESNYNKGIDYLRKLGIGVQLLEKDVRRNESRCTHCGACITICPTAAFELDPITRRVKFHHKKCVACVLCIKACPPRAMEVHF